MGTDAPADREPSTTEIDRVVGHNVRAVWAYRGMVFGVLTAIASGVWWGVGRHAEAVDARLVPLKEAADRSTKNDADHEKRITVMETKLGDIHHDVKEIRRHLLGSAKKE